MTLDERLDAFQEQRKDAPYFKNIEDYPMGKEILSLRPTDQVAIIRRLMERIPDEDYISGRQRRLVELRAHLLLRKLPFVEEDLETILICAVAEGGYHHGYNGSILYTVLRLVEKYAEHNPLSEPMQQALKKAYDTIQAYSMDARKFKFRIGSLLGEMAEVLPEKGEPWADAAIADITALPDVKQTLWKKLFAVCLTADGGKPPAKWWEEAKNLRESIGDTDFVPHIVRWFNLVTVPTLRSKNDFIASPDGDIVPDTDTGSSNAATIESIEKNISLLKGLAWCCVDRDEAEVARALAKLTEACLRKTPGVGPWAVRAATAAVYALSEMPAPEAIAQLGRLKIKISFRTTLNQIEKALETAAARAGMSKSDLEDLAVPAYGFGAEGTRRAEFGECAALATITPTGEITVQWFSAANKPVKSVPAEVKKSFATELKEFKADVEAAEKMLSAQKLRFDSFFLPERTWTLANWRQRYVEHPILGHIARRLIWHIADSEHKLQGIWSDRYQGFVDAAGHPLEDVTDDSLMRLWHPIGYSVEDILRWRNYLLEHEIIQPFKQAHREVYLLTEAELRTHTYSNRFAGHILKQHQMNQLAAIKGWKNRLRMMVDDVYPPATREFPEYGIRAEFWVEGIGDNYGTDTNDAGVYNYLSTDQVRFYRIDAQTNYVHASGGGYSAEWGNRGAAPDPIPLNEVPAILLSEVMRDVDMFVGVTSVGNDPTWQDGGPQGRYRTYWENYSFGDLSETAKTRKQVLERLLPRLKIASRCTLDDRFLIVRGDLRTYRIHLGSANILMEPNDQYLCIVQDRGDKGETSGVNFLPFEGDSRLSVILSKAFLLAGDTKITDVTITRQITL